MIRVISQHFPCKCLLVWVVVCVLILLATAGRAATLVVERDGTGDFVEIQPALDAVASGDTLRIGPGEFTTMIPSYIPGYAWDVDVCAYVHVPTLTIIGAGQGQTVLFPTSYTVVVVDFFSQVLGLA